jgi:hypothetical protein
VGLAESAFDGSLETSGYFCVDAFGRNTASVAVNIFSRLIFFKKTLYKCRTFSTICR